MVLKLGEALQTDARREPCGDDDNGGRGLGVVDGMQSDGENDDPAAVGDSAFVFAFKLRPDKQSAGDAPRLPTGVDDACIEQEGAAAARGGVGERDAFGMLIAILGEAPEMAVDGWTPADIWNEGLDVADAPDAAAERQATMLFCWKERLLL